jgi:L-ascorbate metabolism protein UlaG (beta-lactamase superfamily)
LIEPVLREEELISDMGHVPTNGSLHLWWLGQSGFFVHCGGAFAALDPYLSDSLTAKYVNTDKPHVRMTRRLFTGSNMNLGFASVATSSHNHTDHLDAETLRPMLLSNNAMRLVIPEANRQFVLERLRIGPGMSPHVFQPPIGLDDGESAEVGTFRFTAVPAAHPVLERDDNGRLKHLGYIVRCGTWTIYHSGDTVVYQGMVERLRPFNVDVAILPINGKVGNMNGADAARVAKEIRAKLVIPCHYDMFEFNTADPREQFIPECERLGQPYKVLRAGERWSSAS